MEKEFIPYEQALALKELGFDEPCFAWYHPNMRLIYSITKDKDSIVNAPLWQQAFSWFRNIHNIIVYVTPFKDIGDDLNDPIRFKVFTTKTTNSIEYKTYEEALEIGLQEALKLIK